MNEKTQHGQRYSSLQFGVETLTCLNEVNRVTKTIFEVLCIGIALVFSAIFAAVVIPALVQDGDIIGAFAAGFVNPYSSGYSSDVILCWVVLAVWIFYEAKTLGVKHGWICLALGAVPGVAVGFPLYLVLRNRQLGNNPS